MTEEMIKDYFEHHFKPNPNDNFKMGPDEDASFSRRVPGLSVRYSNPPALVGGCLVPALTSTLKINFQTALLHRLYQRFKI